MKIRCCGVSGGISPTHSTVSTIINDTIAVDAGSLCHYLNHNEQNEISCIFITHAHIDHLMDLCFFADNVVTSKMKTVEVFGTKTSIEYIKQHLFNDKLWPDFSKIKNAGKKPVLEFKELPSHLIRDGIKILPIPVNHEAGAVGYILIDEHESWILTGDSGPTEKIWKEAHKLDNLKGIFMDISFPDRLELIANKSRHLCPKTFKEEYKKLPKDAQIYIQHLKPKFAEETLKEIKALKLPNVHILKTGQIFEQRLIRKKAA